MTFDPKSIRNDNICVIWIDDLIDVFTWRDAFGITIKTPNLDRFVAEGMRFTNTYATVPLCAPCRAELTTGLSPFRTGLVDLNRLWRDILPPTAAWQYDLRRAGFYNFTTGKTDGNYKPMPEAYRRVLFHEDVQAKDAGRRDKVHKYLEKGPGIAGVNHPDDDGSQDQKFYDFRVAQNAIDFLGRADPNRRHLIQLGFKHPHFNLSTPDRFYQAYDVDAIKWPDIADEQDYYGPQQCFAVYEAAYIANGTWTPEKAGDAAWRQVVRAYFAAVSHVDHEIGRFMDTLKSSAFAENTTVVMLSDNGFNLGNHDSFHKMSQWDSASHVPLCLWSARMKGKVADVDLPVSLHNLPKTILDLAGIAPRPQWTSGQSLLPLIDPAFGTFDRSKSPLTCVFGTLSVRPSVSGYEHFRYMRYPNGEEHVYDVVADPGETDNIAETAPMDFLRSELSKAAKDLGLDLSGYENPEDGVNAMMAVDGTVVMAGGIADNDYWAYGEAAEKIVEEKDGGNDTLWYMAGPDDYVLRVPANIENIRVATVVSRSEENPKTGKILRIIAHPDSPLNFETSERVSVDVIGSRGDDVMIGPKYSGAVFHGGAGNDRLVAISRRRKDQHQFFGGEGDDTLMGGAGNDLLDGGSGNDVIRGGSGRNTIIAGPGNDRIHDGEGASMIDTGPGRNLVVSGSGDDMIHVGAGENHITGGQGSVTYHVAYGGLCIISDWTDECVLDLSAWPSAPQISKMSEGVTLRLGSSVIVLKDVYNPETVIGQIKQNNSIN